VLDECLSENFNQWIALFTQIIQSNPNQFFDVKRNALKCLTVIFRDFINYSKECINMILKPAWKLLNTHLRVFTEVQAFGTDIKTLMNEEDADDEERERGYESEDEEEVYGIPGMTLHLVELLTSLVSRPSVQEIVKMGVLPLLTTISSYMVLTRDIQDEHTKDKCLFIYSKDEDLFKHRTVRNCCVDLISKLIEDFQDTSVEALVFIIENLFLTKTKAQSSPSKIKVMQDDQKEVVAEEVNVYEFSYVAPHEQNFWKKREVALSLLGQFAEDIQQFRVRNPSLNLKALATNTLKDDLEGAGEMQMYLRGKSLWCAFNLGEIIPSDYQDLITSILETSAQFCREEQTLSVKLVAIKVILKYARKVKDSKFLLEKIN